MTRRSGAFIVFEGLDRSGKSSQARLLADALRPHTPVELICFPDRTTAIGQCLNSYLRHENRLHPKAAHMLFSANRWEKQSFIEKCLSRGTVVICDRYWYSGVAYTCGVFREDFDWCCSADRGLIQPDLVIYMDAGPDCLKQRGFASGGAEVYEKKDLQERVYDVFKRLAAKEEPSRWVNVNASQTVDNVAKDVMNIVKQMQLGDRSAGFWG